jgi:hypothetical protein
MQHLDWHIVGSMSNCARVQICRPSGGADILAACAPQRNTSDASAM